MTDQLKDDSKGIRSRKGITSRVHQLLDLQKIRLWVCGQPPNHVVGERGMLTNCPLACYIRTQIRNYYRPSVSANVITMTREGHVVCIRQLPSWVSTLVQEVDQRKTQYIDATSFLSIVDEIIAQEQKGETDS